MGAWLGGSNERTDEHEAMMRAAAVSLGFEFEGEGNLGAKYPRGALAYRAWKVNHCMVGQKRGLDVAIFEYEFWINDERYEIRSGILLGGWSADMPSFAMTPQTALSTEVPLFKLDIDFKSHPGFSNAYILHAGDEGDVRAFFNEELLDYFTLNTELDLTVRDNTLFFSSRQLYSELEIEEGLEKALDVVGALEEAAADERFRTRTLSYDADVERRQRSHTTAILNYPIALLLWAFAAFIWHDAGYETAGSLIVMLVLMGAAAIAATFIERPEVETEIETDMNPDKYTPWKSYGE